VPRLELGLLLCYVRSRPGVQHVLHGIEVHNTAQVVQVAAMVKYFRSMIQAAQLCMGHTLHGLHERALQQTTVSLLPASLSWLSSSSGEWTCMCTHRWIISRPPGASVRRWDRDYVTLEEEKSKREGGGGSASPWLRPQTSRRMAAHCDHELRRVIGERVQSHNVVICVVHRPRAACSLLFRRWHRQDRSRC